MSQNHDQHDIETSGFTDQQSDAPTVTDTTIATVAQGLETVDGDETSDEDGSNDQLAERAPVVDLPAVAALETGGEPVQPGPDLSFLMGQVAPAPTFPIEVLPEGLHDLVTSITACQPSSAAHVTTALLATAAAAIGTAAHLQFDRYREPSLLWTLLIGTSDLSRTVAVDNTAAVLTMLGAAAMTEAEAPAGHAVAATLMAEERRKRLQQRIREIADLDGFDVATLACSANETPPPALVTCNDLDPTDIFEQLRRQPRGLLLVFKEAGAFLPGSPPRSEADRSALLAGFDGSPHVYRFKGVQRYVPSLHLSLCAGTQPDKLGQVITRADDLVGRCLMSWPCEPLETPLVSIIDGMTAEFEPVLKRALALTAAAGRFGGQAVGLSVHATEAVNAAARRWSGTATRLAGPKASVYSRARQHALRLALVIQIVEHLFAEKPGLPKFVGPNAQRAAIELLSRFYLPNAERVLDHVSQRNDPDSSLRKIALFIARNAQQGTFNAREMREAPGSPCSRDPEAWFTALDQLEGLQCISKVGRINRIGRPRVDYDLHPAFIAAVFALDETKAPSKKRG